MLSQTPLLIAVKCLLACCVGAVLHMVNTCHRQRPFLFTYVELWIYPVLRPWYVFKLCHTPHCRPQGINNRAVVNPVERLLFFDVICDPAVFWPGFSRPSSYMKTNFHYSPFRVIDTSDCISVSYHDSYSVRNHRPLDCLCNNFFSPTSKKTSKPVRLAHWEWNPQVTDGCASERVSNAEGVSMW